MGCGGSRENIEDSLCMPGAPSKSLVFGKGSISLRLNLEKCPNSHPLLVSKTAKRKCSSCSQYADCFYSCRDCKYKACIECYKPQFKRKSTQLCPKAQKVVWLKAEANNVCRICERKGVAGYYSEQDNYFVCSGNCRRIKNSQTCPNGHSLEWHKLSHRRKCEVCGRRDDRIVECKLCEFVACHYCTEVKHANMLYNNKLKLMSKANKMLLKHPRFEMYRPKFQLILKGNLGNRSQIVRSQSVLKSAIDTRLRQPMFYNNMKSIRNSKKASLRQIGESSVILVDGGNEMNLNITRRSLGRTKLSSYDKTANYKRDRYGRKLYWKCNSLYNYIYFL
eukprot:TRINITY_DN3915_c0_g2_i5.p1 TRINITY_DN3915_c0_g2~~TRINITY_DN3915_c0_g2_i5.p1  ORF type:complete len:335 (-),score=44.23 TRINITY_DN3915_c0_g2_i5:100-1104(-)